MLCDFLNWRINEKTGPVRSFLRQGDWPENGRLQAKTGVMTGLISYQTHVTDLKDKIRSNCNVTNLVLVVNMSKRKLSCYQFVDNNAKGIDVRLERVRIIFLHTNHFWCLKEKCLIYITSHQQSSHITTCSSKHYLKFSYKHPTTQQML